MAPRPLWRGHLRLALVSCPVALVSARHERNNLHFNFINPDTGNRVRMVTLDAETGDELSRSDLVRGFEFKRDHYVILEEADFDAVRLDSSTTLGVDKFVDQGSIHPIHFDSAYLLVPDGDAGRDVYAVLRDAIAATGRIALSRLVLSRRERAVAILPHGRGLVLHTLHEADDLTDAEDAFADVPEDPPDPAMVQLARQLIERQSGQYDPSDVEDRYEARLREVIQAKVEGTGIEPDEPEPPPGGNVIDLMEALRRSLGDAPAKPGARAAPQPQDAKASRTEPPRSRPQSAARKEPAPRKSEAKPTPAMTSAAKSPAAKSGPPKAGAAKGKQASKPAPRPPAKAAPKRPQPSAPSRPARRKARA